jgi:thiopurine S-methyltransferase
LQPDFWHQRWRNGQIGFHQPVVTEHLKRHWPSLGLASHSPVLVPLCGKSLDLLWLRERGHYVLGAEISTIALESLLMEHGVAARRRRGEKFDVYQAERLELFCGDFFSLTAPQLGPVAGLYDRAALISWAAELRDAYVAHVTALTAPGTQTLLVSMEYPQQQMTGPPFSVSASEVKRLYAKNHSIQELSRIDILADEPRLRSRGLTRLHEVCYRLIRL